MDMMKMGKVVVGGIGGGVVANLSGNLIAKMGIDNTYAKAAIKIGVGVAGGMLIQKFMKQTEIASGFFAGAAYEGSRELINSVMPNFLSGLEMNETVEEYLMRQSGVHGLPQYDEQLSSGVGQYLIENGSSVVDNLSDEQVLALNGLSDDALDGVFNETYSVVG